ncbi:F-box protein PP2-B10-like [Papaver somniferum]|uniref:F-box protein PP2-B10-like n=1 Tax=Papaver somniferum TaxID=3469 RepID=UPI000E705CDB|nr:F-box protein PP2-B10-like [Papaver somniferum]
MDNIERLPEGCISDILSLTSPADACRSSLVLTLFKSEADSDALWEKFLPADYQEIISRAFYPFPSAALSKKELYYRLSDDPLLIDAGLKSFQLEKSSGKKCIMLGAKELAIAWRHNPNHWRWEGHPGSRFPQVAELQWICWFEIRGKLDTTMLSPKTYYAAYLVVRLNGDVYGFNGEPIKAKVKVVGQAGDNSSVCSKERLIYFDVGGEHSPPDPVLEGQYIARERGDGWMEVELGHFYNEGGDSEGWEVHMSVLEIGRTKRGLIVQDDLGLSCGYAVSSGKRDGETEQAILTFIHLCRKFYFEIRLIPFSQAQEQPVKPNQGHAIHQYASLIFRSNSDELGKLGENKHTLTLKVDYNQTAQICATEDNSSSHVSGVKMGAIYAAV